MISTVGGVLLAQIARITGLDRHLSLGVRLWRRSRAIHDPAKILVDLAITVALGGDCAADIALLRAQPGVFGKVASDPTVSRGIDDLADAGTEALTAIRAARASARAWVWQRVGAPTQDGWIVLDPDATVLISHSEKENAAKTWKKTLTGLVDLSAWPAGTRLVVRKERPHPGAQLRITDLDGHRITGFLTNTPGRQLADLELRHRRHARVEDRIRAGKDTGLRNLPFHDAAQNRVWLEICALAAELIAFTQRLALTGWARIAEPKRLRLHLFSVAGRVVRTGRRHVLKIPATWPWAEHMISAHARLARLAST